MGDKKRFGVAFSKIDGISIGACIAYDRMVGGIEYE